MKQRRKQPVQTRKAILEAAGVEFSRNGYAGTGIGPIVARAELTKGALFHHFPDKRTLAITWITEELAAAIRFLWVTPLETLRSLDAFRSFCRARCLEIEPGDATSTLVALAAEVSAAESSLGSAFEAVFNDWRLAVSTLLDRGKSEGWIHHSIQPATEASFFVSVFSGFTVTTRSNTDENSRRTCAAAVEAYLETLRAQ